MAQLSDRRRTVEQAAVGETGPRAVPWAADSAVFDRPFAQRPERLLVSVLQSSPAEGFVMSTLLLILLILVLVGALPTWPHSRSWGYYPSGGVGLIVLILIILLLTGRL
jgi:hypothetical protein